MKTIVPNTKSLNCLSLFLIGILLNFTAQSQTYTTITNGTWSNASTWQGGSIPDAGNIPAGAIVNIKHVVSYSGGNIQNNGTINIANPGGLTPRLTVASGVDFQNNSTGKVYIRNAEYRQYRFIGGLETGVAQQGNFINSGGFVEMVDSYVEIAEEFENKTNGVRWLNNSSVVLGKSYKVNSNAIDSLYYSSVSMGWHDSSDFDVNGASIYFWSARFQIAGSTGDFRITGSGNAGGTIDYITLKNHFTGVVGLGKITVTAGVSTAAGLKLDSYCTLLAANYVPNGKFTGAQTADCGKSLFPIGLIWAPSQASVNMTTDPVLVAGTDKQVGAQYKYEGVAPGVDVIVKIDSLVGGATIAVLDDNSNGAGFKEGFQPQIKSGSIVGKSYAVFSLNYKITGTSVSHAMSSFTLTALDIDGSGSLKEFDEIGMGPGTTAAYAMGSPAISMTEVAPGTFKGINSNGNSVGGVDTSAKEYMFTVTNTNVSTFTLKLGTETTSPSSSIRLFSVYMKGFAYPNAATLPLELLSFNAILIKNKVDLNWVTLWEKNLSHFEVERSFDGKNFSQIASVFGAGNSDFESSYGFSDNTFSTQSKGIIYYRLKLMDIDGKYGYSDIRVIRMGKFNETVKVMTYPNPVVNDVRITVPNEWQGKEVKYDVYNAAGRMVYSIRNSSASQTEVINMSSLGKGFYMVKVSMGAEVAQQKIIKN